jgi:nucleoside-diphosphate-sugar epimerase
MIKGKPPVVDWDGKQSRDFTYVANVVEANLRACAVRGISGEVFNIACGTTSSIMDIVKELNKMLKTNIAPVYAPKRPGDIRMTYADVSRMKRVLGIRKIVAFEQGLRLTLDWFRSR